jgi:type II secretory pathway component HofQ
MATKKTTTKKTTTTKATKKKPTGTKAKAKISQMAAAERVLAEADEPMNCQQMVEAMTKKRLWKSPDGKTPHATLYASLLRHINKHGKDARFRKTDRGMFALAGRRGK